MSMWLSFLSAMVFTEDEDPPLTVEELKINHLLDESETDYMGVHVDNPTVKFDTASAPEPVPAAVLLSSFEELRRNPVFLPDEYLIWGAKVVLAITLIITVVNALIYILWKSNETPSRTKNDESFAKRASYQITHFIVNVVLAFTGLYYYTTVTQYPHEVKYRVMGWEDDFAFFCHLQLAYNLWAIPAGIVLVQERYEMIGHHIGVVFVSFISGFLTNGFRFFAPFFFGAVEVSSIPLTVMNIFKSNQDLANKFPTTNTVVSVLFAITFLYIRIILWLPLMYDFLYVVFQTGISHPMDFTIGLVQNIVSIIPYCLVFASGSFLTCLQLLWGYKVVKALLRMVGLFKKSSKTKKDE